MFDAKSDVDGEGDPIDGPSEEGPYCALYYQLEEARKEQRLLARDVEVDGNPLTGYYGHLRRSRRKFLSPLKK